MVENLANKFEKTMKKGFVNLFVLLVLNKEPTHGYQIKKLIEERTFGFWKPTDSTIYTILKGMHDKGLIMQNEPADSDESKKVYELTEKGKEMLDLLIQREREMRESLNAIIFSTTEIDNKFMEKSIFDFILSGPKFPRAPHMNNSFMEQFKDSFTQRIEGLPKENQLKILNFQKEFISHRLEEIEKLISKLKSDTTI